MADQKKTTPTVAKPASKAPVKTSVSSVAKPAANQSQAPKKNAKPAAKAVVKKASAKKVAAKKPAVKKVVAKKPVAAKKSAVKRVTKKAVPAPKKVSAAKTVPTNFSQFLKPNNTMEKMMSQSKSQMDKFAKDATDAGRENMEAFIKSSTIFAKGFEDIMRTAMSMAQGSAEAQTKFVKEALSAKTLNEWTEVQNKIAQKNFDDFMSGATKISEMGVKVLSDCVEPINEQVAKGVKKASEAIAA